MMFISCCCIHRAASVENTESQLTEKQIALYISAISSPILTKKTNPDIVGELATEGLFVMSLPKTGFLSFASSKR